MGDESSPPADLRGLVPSISGIRPSADGTVASELRRVGFTLVCRCAGDWDATGSWEKYRGVLDGDFVRGWMWLERGESEDSLSCHPPANKLTSSDPGEVGVPVVSRVESERPATSEHARAASAESPTLFFSRPTAVCPLLFSSSSSPSSLARLVASVAAMLDSPLLLKTLAASLTLLALLKLLLATTGGLSDEDVFAVLVLVSFSARCLSRKSSCLFSSSCSFFCCFGEGADSSSPFLANKVTGADSLGLT